MEELTIYYSSLSHPFYPKRKLKKMSRSQGTPGKISLLMVIKKIPPTLVVTSGKIALLRGVARITPLQSCCRLYQVVLDLQLFRHHQRGGGCQLATAQGTPCHL